MRMRERLEAKVRIHDLWLLGSHLNLFFREFQFIPDPDKRSSYRERAERIFRNLIELRSESHAAGDHAIRQNLSEPPTGMRSGAHSSSGMKRSFDLTFYADSHFASSSRSDEVSK